MGKHKRIISFLFAILFALQPFLVLPVKADTPTPAPASICVRENHNLGGGYGQIYRIKCTLNGKTVIFSAQGAVRESDHEKWPLVESAALQIPNSPGVISIWVEKPNGNYDTLRIKALMGGNVSADQRQDLWTAQQLAGLSAAQRPIAVTLNALRRRFPQTVVAAARPAPSTATIAGCNAQVQKRISDGDGVQQLVNGMKQQFLDAVTASDQAAQSKQDAIKGINNIFGNADDFISASRDKELYKTYYNNSDSQSYPNVEIVNSVMDSFRDLVSGLGTLSGSIGFNAMEHWGVAAGAIQSNENSGGLLAATTGLAIGITVGKYTKNPLIGAIAGVGVAGTINGASLGNAITRWQNKREYNQLLKKEIEIILAYTYIKKNLAYNKCAAGLTPPDTAFAKYDAAMDTQADSLFKSTTDIGTGLNTEGGANKTICDNVKGNYITAMFGTAFCGMIIVLKGWADSAYLWAIKLMAASIGLDNGDYGITVTPGETGVEGTAGGADPAAGGGAGGGAGETTQTTLEKAIALCNSKKPAATAPAADQNAWKKGPCLSTNIESTGYAVDVAHNPRSNAVDNANVCAGNPAKFVELDLTCAKIRMVPEETSTGGGTVPAGPTTTSGSTTLKGKWQANPAASAQQLTTIGNKLTTLFSCNEGNLPNCKPKAKIQATMKDANGVYQPTGSWIDATFKSYGNWNIMSGNDFHATIVGNKKFNGVPDGISVKIIYGSNSISFWGLKDTINNTSGNSNFYTNGN